MVGLAKLDTVPVAVEAVILDEEVAPNAENDGVVLAGIEAPVVVVTVAEAAFKLEAKAEGD